MDVVNAGVGGTTVASAYASFAYLLSQTWASHRVTNVLMNWGVNDLTVTPPGTLPDQTTWTNQYISMVEQVKAKWPMAQVWIARPYKNGGFDTALDTLATWITDVVAAHPSYVHLGFDERVWFKPNIAPYSLLYSDDGTHYNAAGQAECAVQWSTTMGY